MTYNPITLKELRERLARYSDDTLVFVPKDINKKAQDSDNICLYHKSNVYYDRINKTFSTYLDIILALKIKFPNQVDSTTEESYILKLYNDTMYADIVKTDVLNFD